MEPPLLQPAKPPTKARPCTPTPVVGLTVVITAVELLMVASLRPTKPPT